MFAEFLKRIAKQHFLSERNSFSSKYSNQKVDCSFDISTEKFMSEGQNSSLSVQKITTKMYFSFEKVISPQKLPWDM